MRLKLALLVLGALVVVFLSLRFSGATPIEAANALFRGSLGSASAVTGTLREMVPLLMAGLAVFIALRAGLFNIGVEGQLVVGALCCTLVAINVPGFGGMTLGLIAGAAGGALWAWPAGLIRAYRNGHEVITTIMLNHVAAQITGYLVSDPLRRKGAGFPITAEVSETARIPKFSLFGVQTSWSLLLAALLIAALWYWLKRTVGGYELQAVGANPRAAAVAGVETRRVIVAAMAWSGAIAGVTGSVIVLGFQHSFSSAISASYGFTALGVALLAGGAPFALFIAAFLFAALKQGGLDLQDYAPKGIINIIIGLVLIVFAAVRYRRQPTGD